MQNTAVVSRHKNREAFQYFSQSFSTYRMKDLQTQEQRGAANGISMTLMSFFKGVAPAAAGTL